MSLRIAPDDLADRMNVAETVGSLRPRAEREVNGYALLEPGWDGPGSIAPSPEAIREAIAFVRCLPPSVAAPEPMVASDGEVGVFWRHGGAFIDVGFRGTGTVSYHAEAGHDHRPIHGEDSFTGIPIPEALLAVIAKLPVRR